MKTFKVVLKSDTEGIYGITITVKAENSHEALWKLVDAGVGGAVDSLTVIDNGNNTNQKVKEL